jgi:hypothetical protein
MTLDNVMGFQMLTVRAKRWATSYRNVVDPNDLNDWLYVSPGEGAQILADLDETSLNVIMDETGANNA